MTEEKRGLNRRHLIGAGAAVVAAAGIKSAVGAAENSKSLSGKSVLITGSSSGFGRLIAIDMARKGAKVVASMRNLDGGNRPEAIDLRNIAKQEKLDITIVEIDVLNDDLVVAGVQEAERIAGGALDILVNNAGIGTAGPVEAFDLDASKLIMDTNFFGYLRMANAVLPAMRTNKQGLIVNISSQLGRILIPNLGLYSASKFGVEAAFETMAYELAPTGVEVTIIEPGGYPTKVWANGKRYTDDMLSRVSDERKTAYAQHISGAEAMQNGNYSTDPMDIPKAITEIAAMPVGSRPLRRAVHPNTQATDAVNATSAKMQAAVLGSGPYGAWHKAVTS